MKLLKKWFDSDRRMNHNDAVHMIACAHAKNTSRRVLVATDNSRLRNEILKHRSSVQLGAERRIGRDVGGIDFLFGAKHYAMDPWAAATLREESESERSWIRILHL